MEKEPNQESAEVIISRTDKLLNEIGFSLQDAKHISGGYGIPSTISLDLEESRDFSIRITSALADLENLKTMIVPPRD